MMECNIVRDLMPLIQDGVASEESRSAVQEHVTGCPACAEYMNDMQAELTASPQQSEREKEDFDKTAHKLRKKRRSRVWRNVLIGVMVGVVLVLGGMWGWARLTQDYATPVYIGDYSVILSQLADGRVVISIDTHGSYSDVVANMEERNEDGSKILYIFQTRPVIEQIRSQPMRNYCFTLLPIDTVNGFSEIRQGTQNEHDIVWQKGGFIPAASAEMEAYFKLEDQIMDISMPEAPDSKTVDLTYDDLQRLDELYEAREDAKEAVPEWKWGYAFSR